MNEWMSIQVKLQDLFYKTQYKVLMGEKLWTLNSTKKVQALNVKIIIFSVWKKMLSSS